jgi:hypothetical protein
MNAHHLASAMTNRDRLSKDAEAQAMARFLTQAQLPAIPPLPGSSERRRSSSTAK